VRAGRTGEPEGKLEQLETAVERPAGNHVEGDVGVTVVETVAAAAPVITGKTTTRKRSTRPASRSDRQKVRLPSVPIELVPSRFITPTASTASPLTSRVLAHDNGACSVEENTTLDTLASFAK
jgi:hypothetical protein